MAYLKHMIALSAVILACQTVATLPPGYEDDAWCPENFCLRNTKEMEGIAGPRHAFVECHDEIENVVVDEMWTGFRVETNAPDGWTKALACAKMVTDDDIVDSVKEPLFANYDNMITDKFGSLFGTQSDLSELLWEDEIEEVEDSSVGSGTNSGTDLSSVVELASVINQVKLKFKQANKNVNAAAMPANGARQSETAEEYEYEYGMPRTYIYVQDNTFVGLLAFFFKITFFVFIFSLLCKYFRRLHALRNRRTELPTTEKYVHQPVLLECQVVTGTEATFAGQPSPSAVLYSQT